MSAVLGTNRSARDAWILLLFVAIGTTLLAATFALTEETIIQREDEEKMKVVAQILPHDLYDNRVLRDTTKVQPAELLNTREVTIAYRARKQGQPVAALFEAIAPNGYGGKIKLLIAVQENGELLGVRVLAHNETVGWGDYIEAHKSNWINMFQGASLERYSDREWQVKKDGGRFDYQTRATISSRAIVTEVHHALKYYAENKHKLYEKH